MQSDYDPNVCNANKHFTVKCTIFSLIRHLKRYNSMQKCAINLIESLVCFIEMYKNAMRISS